MAFLGIRITNEIGRLLKGVEVPGIPETPSEYHISILIFDKDLPIKTISKTLTAAYEVISEFKSFLVKVNTVGCFPAREGKPLPIIAHVKSEALHELRKKLCKKFDKEGIKYDKTFKEFKPHITLAYYEHEKEINNFKIDPMEFSVNEVVLWGGDNGDDKVFITFPLKSPESHKKSFQLLNKAHMFYKIAKHNADHYVPDMTKVHSWMERFNGDEIAKQEEYDQYGGWTKYSFKLVPINDIEHQDIWQESKMSPLLERMENNLPIDPIRLGESALTDGKWSIVDGIHRVAASKKMGYTKIPAFCAEWIKTKPN